MCKGVLIKQIIFYEHFPTFEKNFYVLCECEYEVYRILLRSKQTHPPAINNYIASFSHSFFTKWIASNVMNWLFLIFMAMFTNKKNRIDIVSWMNSSALFLWWKQTNILDDRWRIYVISLEQVVFCRTFYWRSAKQTIRIECSNAFSRKKVHFLESCKMVSQLMNYIHKAHGRWYWVSWMQYNLATILQFGLNVMFISLHVSLSLFIV